MSKCRLCEKVGNLAFALSANWLRINTFVCCINFRLFGFSLSDHALRKLSSTATISSYVCQKWSCPATRSPREDQALLLCRRLPLVPNKASSDAGRRTAKRWPCGDGKPEGPDRPLEKGAGGIEISKSSQRQPCCLTHVAQPANN